MTTATTPLTASQWRRGVVAFIERTQNVMPLNTQIIRNGEAIPLRWGDFHVCAMALAAAFDTQEPPFGNFREIYDTPELTDGMWDCYPDAPFPVTRSLAFEMTSYPVLAKTPLNFGEYTLKRRHKFVDLTDGEVLELLPGDVLRAIRGW